ncbi:MAG: hypothetical protein HY320_06665 [Armatimonadetes bacterium]|nr:hypothetical protein [Armatimonadota bacterium]
MKETIAIVEGGRIVLPPEAQIPDGARVRIIWDEEKETGRPYEREPLAEEEVRADLEWATGTQFLR